ncbi:MAG: N-acetylmuramoyl-L-alanine amidase [Thermoleophilaceae bacterium]
MPRDLGIAARLRRDGLRVREVSGWQTRGDSSFFPRGFVNHHTAGASRSAGVHPSLGILINGRSDLPGPLCQVSLDYEGVVYVIAAGRANHAGIPDGGAWRGLTGNTSAWGLEIEHPGTFPLEPERYELAARVHAALIRGTVDESKVGQHWEWAPSRKIDLFSPRTLDPDHFRSRVAHHLANPGEEADDLPDPKDIWTYDIPGGKALGDLQAQTHVRRQTLALGRLEAAVAQLLKQSGVDVDEEALAAAVLEGLSPQAIAAAIGPDVAEQVAAELGRRLRS